MNAGKSSRRCDKENARWHEVVGEGFQPLSEENACA
jgi:hypothetical protein